MQATETGRNVASQVSGQSNSSHAGSERSHAQAGSSSKHEPLFYSPNTPASYQPVTGGTYDSDQSTSRDQESVLPESCPAAYTLEWGPHLPCTRTPVDIDAVGASRSFDTPGSVEIGDHSRVDAIRRAWKCNKDLQASASAQEAGPSSSSSAQVQKLHVFHDTSDEEVNRIICSVLDIDPAFLAAHTAGQRYRPRERPWRVGAGKSTAFSATSYVYPQTLTVTVPGPRPPAPSRDMATESQTDGAHAGSNPRIPNASAKNGNGSLAQSQDGGEKAPDASSATIELNNRGRAPLNNYPYPSRAKTIDSPVAMLCRASLWTSPRANVIFLDQNPSSTSLEDAFFDALDDVSMSNSSTAESETVADFLTSTLTGLAYDQWLDFVDALTSNHRGARQGRLNKKLLWDMAQRLEQNLATSQAHEKQQLSNPQKAANLASPGDWQALLSRLLRTVSLLPLQTQGPSAVGTGKTAAHFRAADTSYTVSRIPSGDIDNLPSRYVPEVEAGSKTSDSHHSSAGAINAKRRPSFSQTPAGQNALNRITYMGGILLPFSIIAGVLSMSDPFGPGDRLFWVFWVITLPITCLTLAIIYADDIRKSYIWKPMNHQSLQEAINKGEAIPAAAAATLAHAAERIINRISAAESDSDIESGTVLSAVRSVDFPGSAGRRARVRVNTDSGPGGPTFYRLSEPSRPETTAAVVPTQAQLGQHSSPVVPPDGNVQIDRPIMNASMRRRFHILGPLRRAWPTKARPNNGELFSKPESDPSSFPDNIEPANPYGETVVIDMARPNVDPGIAEMFGPPDGIDVAAPGCPTILLPQRRRDTDPAAWRRQQLGWIGAIKKMTGYLKTRDA
ncbi:hypothetical protein SCUCBS95973_009219 [Sporothrix curviconia]|uniref:Uncharacterized protein n=1 Tax=Sporothrix curviconia TaxID=1260050 RepID=A0ABP0CT66_9PEZI